MLGFALADIINEHSTWLRASPVETTGTFENNLLSRLPENQQLSVFAQDPGNFYNSRAGIVQYEDKGEYLSYAIAKEFQYWAGMFTLDPDIKTWEDLKGKRVNLFYQGSTLATVYELTMKLHGVTDESLWTYFGFGKGKDALLDGTIDATGTIATTGPIFSIFAPNPATEEILAARPLYNVPLLPEDQAKIQQGQYIPFTFGTLPQSMDSRMTSDWLGFYATTFYAGDRNLPDDIAYEVARLMYEYGAQEGPAYHAAAKGWTKDTLYQADVERRFFHPGALKFWDEIGVQITFQEPSGLEKPAYLK